MEQKKKTQKMNLNKKQVKTILIAVFSVLLAVAVCLGSISAYNEWMLKKVSKNYVGMLQVEGIYDMGIDDAAEKERIKGTNRHGQKGAFDYFCDERITFASATNYGTLVLGNPEWNTCDLVATIFDEGGNLLYQSDGIAPGKYLSTFRLMANLEPGEHNCRLYVAGFDTAKQKPVGVQYTKLQIVIEENIDG